VVQKKGTVQKSWKLTYDWTEYGEQVIDLAEPTVMLPTGIGGIVRNCAEWDCMASFSLL
jgi:hypothetical protein